MEGYRVASCSENDPSRTDLRIVPFPDAKTCQFELTSGAYIARVSFPDGRV